MLIADAQRNMRYAYFGGAPGVFASSLVWFIAGLVALINSPSTSMMALFVGGMFIHPAGMFISKTLGRPGNHNPNNPLGLLALESTAILLLSLPLAYAISQLEINWFFPAMMMVIGGRYLVFSTIYGLRTYWACGFALVAVSFLLVMLQAPFLTGPFAGAIIEFVVAGFLFTTERSEKYS